MYERDYSLFLRAEAIEALKTTRGQQRRQISTFIDLLGTNPNMIGDYPEMDDNGRRLEIKVIGRFAITFWTDHAAKEIKVLDIRPADQA